MERPPAPRTRDERLLRVSDWLMHHTLSDDAQVWGNKQPVSRPRRLTTPYRAARFQWILTNPIQTVWPAGRPADPCDESLPSQEFTAQRRASLSYVQSSWRLFEPRLLMKKLPLKVTANHQLGRRCRGQVSV